MAETKLSNKELVSAYKRKSNKELYKSYNSTYVAKDIQSRLTKLGKDSQSLLDGYNSRFFDKDGKYITDVYRSSEDAGNWLYDIVTKKEALDSESKAIKDLFAEYGEFFNKDYVTDVIKTLDSNNEVVSNVVSNSLADKEYWDKFETEDEYNEAVKLSDLYNMSTAEIQPNLDAIAKTEEENKSKISSLNSEKSQIKSNLQQHNRGNKKYSTPEKKKAAEDRVKEIDREISRLEKGESGIAYTTLGGQNITWQSLYDQKKAEEDFNALYGHLSSTDDWEESVKKAKEYQNPSSTEAEANASFFGWDIGETNLPVNKVTYYEKYAAEIAFGEANGGGSTQVHSRMSTMKDGEKDIYNYYFGRGEYDKAEEYLKSLESTLQKRFENKLTENTALMADEHPVLASAVSVLFNIASGAEYIRDTVNYIGTEELDTNHGAELSNAIRGTVAEKVDWEIGNWDAFDFVYNTGMSMADSLASQALFGKFGGVALGLSAAAQGTNDALNRGMSNKQAFWNGFMSGVFEGLFESVSIGNFNALKESATTGFKSFAKNLGKSMLVNASEETLTEIANIAYDMAINGDFSHYETSIRQYMGLGMSESEAKKQTASDLAWQVAESAGSGTLMGIGMGGGAQGISAVNSVMVGKQLKNSGLTQKVLDFANTFDDGTITKSYASGLDDKASAYSVGALLKSVGADLSAQNIADITRQLEAKGIPSADAQTISKWLYESASNGGSALSGSQIKALENNPVLSEVMQEIVLKKSNSVNARTEEYQNILRTMETTEAKSKAKAKVVKALEKDGMTTEKATEIADIFLGDKSLDTDSSKSSVIDKIITEGKFEVSDDGKTVNTKTGDVVEVVNISGISDSGEVDLTLKDGTVVEASDISFGNPAEAAFVGYISEMRLGKNAISAETANNLYQAAMSALRSNPDMTVSEASSLVRGLAEAYTYGAYSFGEERLTETDENGKAKRFAGELTDTQRRFAYELGKKDRTTKVEAEQKAITEAKGKAKPSKEHLGKIVFENGINVNESDLSDFQKANLEGIKLLAEISSIEFHIYQTEKVNGKWQYTMADGTVVGANGWYVAGTNEIWVDLNAGEFGEGAMIRTAAHEISHYIKEKSPKQWQAMADLLMQTFAENDVDVESMLNRQIAKIKRRHKSNKDTVPSQSALREMAYEELVSDALSDMLTDGSIVNFIAEVKAKDQSLRKRILEAIRNLLKKWGLVVDSYKGKDLDTAEAQALSQFEDTFKKLQEMYQEALMDANEVAKAQKNTAKEGDVKNVKLSERDFSYDELIAKDDLQGVVIDKTQHPKIVNGIIDNAWVVKKVREKCETLTEKGRTVYYTNVPDIGTNIEITAKSLTHGFTRPADRKNNQSKPNAITNARVTLAIPQILKNSIEVNRSQRGTNIDVPYTHVLIGTVALEDSNGVLEYYAVRSMVQERKNQEPILVEADILGKLTSVNAKKIGSPTTQVGGNTVALVDGEAYTYKIADLLNDVKGIFDNTFSKDVYQHFGMTQKVDDFSQYLLFSDRDPDSVSTRSLLANALEGAVQNDIERKKLGEYKEKIALLDSEQQKLSEIQKQLFTKGAVDPDTRKKLQLEAKQISNRINIYDRQLLNLEATKALKNVLEREKTRARKRQKEIDNMILQGQKDKAAAKQRELMDRYKESRRKATESRHRTAMRHKIKNVVSELNQLLLKGSKERNVKLGLQSAVASALDAINMDTVAADERIAKLEQELKKAKTPEKMQEISRKIENIRAQGDKMASKLEALKKAYEKIKTNSEDTPDYFKAEAGIIEERIASVIDIVGDTPLRNMSLYQLEAVHDLYSMVLATVRNANSVFLQGKLEDLQQNATATMEEISAVKTLSEERIGMGWLRSFSWNEMVPIYAFRRMGSKTFEKFFWEAIKGQNTVARDLEEANNFAKETRSKYNYNKWDLDKVHEFKLADGRTFRVTLRHMMSIYAYSKREQALDHMAKGGFFFNDKATFRKKGGVINLIKSNEVGYSVDLNTLQAIANEMTSEQLQYVDEMQDYLTQLGRKGNEVSRVLWGIDIFKEKVYFPLKSVKDFIFQTNQTVQESSLKNDGMTKETKPHASNPIVLEAFDDVWASHVNRMSQYHGLVLPIENLNKIHSYGTWANSDSVSVSTMLRARFGEVVNDYINQFIKDLNGASSTSGASNPFFGLVGKFKKTAVAASMSVVAQQPTAILRAMAVMDTKYFIGLPEARLLKTKWNEVKKHAPIAIIKEIGGFDAGAGRQATEWLNSDTLKGLDKVSKTIDDVTMKGAAIGDQVGWCTIWEAVKREIKATTDLKVGSDEFLSAVGERFTEIIVLTQVYDSTLSRSGFMRSKHDSVKMLTSFMGEPTVSFNMLYDATIQAKRKTITKRKAGRIVGSVYASVIAASIAASLIYALRDDDEDESYAEKFAEAFGDKLLDDINPLNMLPGVRDIVSILDGWDVERTDMAIFKDIKDAFDGLASENKSSWKKVEDFAGAVASLFGVPLKNLLRTGREFYNAFENIFDGISPSGVDAAFIRGLTGEKKDKGKALYDAIVNGDDARVEVYRKGYKDETAYETALRKALRENDPRIKEAAEARFNGDFDEYERLFEEIENEGNFEFDTIKSAINTEFNKLDADDEETVEEDVDKVESIYSTSDMNAAFDNGDTSSALEIIDDIVRIKTENYIADGETEKDAKTKAQASVKASMTAYWKPLYIAAYQNKDNEEMKRIRIILLSSGLYGRANDVVKTGMSWIKSSKK